MAKEHIAVQTEIITSDERDIDTRFGKIKISSSNKISFPHGMIGMPEVHNFALAPCPIKKYSHFTLLQSLDNEELCFLTLPVASSLYKNPDSLISSNDIESVCSAFGIKEENLAVILIATIHNDENNQLSNISVNLRAPIILDTSNKVGGQYVFLRSEYAIRHFLKEQDNYYLG